MAQDDHGSGNSFPTAGIFAFLLFASGMIVQHQPLQSERPGSIARQDTPNPNLQIVEARLWQDPFDAIQRREKDLAEKAKQQGKPLEEANSVVQFRRLLEPASQATLILPVMVYGGPYAEDVEDRRRARYAVLSALRAANFEPVNYRGIGFVQLPGTDGKSEELQVPFERWTRMPPAEPPNSLPPHDEKPKSKDSPWEEVIVLWLREEWINPALGMPLKDLLNELLPERAPHPDWPITVLGPTSPNTVTNLKINNEASKCPNGRLRFGRHCVAFISPGLTEPDNGRMLPILRMSPSDDQIASAIIEELLLRGLEIPQEGKHDAPCKDHLVLIVETDTHYGRSLEREFRRRLAACHPDAAGADRHLHIYRYFRGLDGRVAVGPDLSKKASDGSGSDQGKKTAPEERAQGDGQYDYLLRVATVLRRKNEQIGEKNPDRIRAVIVLGTDIYDKLSVFQALRESLPQAVFATNDLDAALLERDRLKWTRNAIVASGYGLTLRNFLRTGTPPFRDTYQSATFLATRYALGLPDQVDRPGNTTERQIQTVRMFEIGNGIYVPLDRTPHDYNFKKLFLIALAVAVLAGFAWVFSWWTREMVFRRGAIIAAAVAAIGAYVALAIWTSHQPGEEPLSWVQGVSAWPSNFIRLAVIVWAIFSLVHTQDNLRKSDEALEESFKEQGLRSSGTVSGTRAWKDVITTLLRLRRPLPEGAEGDKKVDVNAIWEDYRKATSYAETSWRVIFGVVLLGILSAIVMSGFEQPVSPVRGPVSISIDQATIRFAVLMVGLFTMFVIERVAAATFFLRELYGDHDRARMSRWNASVIKEHCGFQIEGDPQDIMDRAVHSYVDLRLSAQLTTYIGRIVIYPFMLVLLLMLARSRFFDNWVMPTGLFVVIALGLVLVTIAAFSLRHTAERIRHYTIEQLIAAEIVAKAPHPTGAGNMKVGPTAEQLHLMRETAGNLREGAFAPLAEQPIVRALILPFGGAGLVSLLEWAMYVKW